MNIHQLLNSFVENYILYSPKNYSTSAPLKVALAVSGGADSIALLHLFTPYHLKQKLDLTILTVDHQLRPTSIKDVDFVRSNAKELKLPFYNLIWQHDNLNTDIQARARSARYQLMTSKCQELGINIILTAHHYDDFLENYVMRRARTDNILGLSYKPITYINNIQILRSLHQFSKQDLLNYLISNNLTWREDPSNQKDIYERNRVRQKLASYSTIQLTMLKKEVEEINQQAIIINQRLIELIAKYVEFNNFGFAKIILAKNIESNLLIYLLNHVLTMVSGQTVTTRYRSIINIINKLLGKENFTVTIHGCILKRINRGVNQNLTDILLIFREKHAILNQDINCHNQAYWDNRFIFCQKNIISANSYKISKLDQNNYLILRKKLDLSLLVKISYNQQKLLLFTLPVIKKLEKVIAIPHISYYDEEVKFKANFYFAPKFTSRFTHF